MKSTFPITEITSPVENGAVEVSLSFEVLDHTAKNLRVWLRLCKDCKYGREPQGFLSLNGHTEPSERMLLVGDFLPGQIFSPITTFSVLVPPPPFDTFVIPLVYGCENCDIGDFDTNAQVLAVHMQR